jgi:predicted Rossmann-fold nucleotide-binding protein
MQGAAVESIDADDLGQQDTVTAIKFPNGNEATAVHAVPRRTVRSLLEAIELSGPAPVLVVVGGADAMEASIAPRLERLFERGALRAAADAGAVVLDGGTQSGVMAALGHAVALSEVAATLVGVAPGGKVTYPGDTRAIAGSTHLEPNHSHFILANSSEWGGETALLFDVIDLIAEGRPAVAIVAAGGPGTVDEVAMASRRGMPLVVLAGTGGAADRLAAAAASMDRTSASNAADRLAALVAEAHVIVVPADAAPDQLRHLLTRLLKDDETLRYAWRQHESVARTARRRQTSFRRQQKLLLGLGVALTLAVAIQVVLERAGLFGQAPAVGDVLHYAIVLVPIIIGVLGAAMTHFRPGSQWILLRGTAEAIKREIFRYRAQAGIYSLAETRRRPRELKLAQAVGSAMGALMRTDVNMSALEAAPRGETVVPEGLATGDDGFAPLRPGRYVQFRVDDQIEFYRKRARERERDVRRLRWLMLLFGGLGTFLAAIGFEIWVAVTVAVAGALTSYLEAMQLETTVTLYNQAAADLEAIRAWWLALPPGEQVRPATIDRLVERSEDIMKAEHSGWVQQMQDAMTKFRLDGVEEEGQGAARSGGRQTDRQPAKMHASARSQQQAVGPPVEPQAQPQAPDERPAGTRPV